MINPTANLFHISEIFGKNTWKELVSRLASCEAQKTDQDCLFYVCIFSLFALLTFNFKEAKSTEKQSRVKLYGNSLKMISWF